MTGIQAGAVALVVCAAMLAFLVAIIQSSIGAKVGTDHPVHVFLTNAIRANGRRVFVKIPRLLNTCYCGSLPLYIHWVVALWRPSAVAVFERVLNPLMGSLQVILLAVIVMREMPHWVAVPDFAPLCALLLALTPQYYHALSARNFGLSARGTGLLVLTGFFYVAYVVESGDRAIQYWIALGTLSWLVWGLSTFSQQAMCLVSSLLLVATGRYVPAAGVLLGLAIFVSLHPAYSLGYLKHTGRFIRTYATELAPIYVLSRRFSVWRDLVWDIWRGIGRNGIQGLRYAYENSILIVAVLNPLTIVGVWAALHRGPAELPFDGFCAAMMLAGIAVFVLTSFRCSRFLGEPERYVEAVTPWATIYAARFLAMERGTGVLIGVAAVFLLADVVQLLASLVLSRHTAGSVPELGEVAQVISKNLGKEVRFCSNNEQWTKRLMQHGWEYAYCIAVGQDYCGMSLGEAFSTFPLLRKKACQRIVKVCRINACLLDRGVFDTLFEELPDDLISLNIGFESERFRLVLLDWKDPTGPRPAQ
jgi:hypothetical protein